MGAEKVEGGEKELGKGHTQSEMEPVGVPAHDGKLRASKGERREPSRDWGLEPGGSRAGNKQGNLRAVSTRSEQARAGTEVPPTPCLSQCQTTARRSRHCHVSISRICSRDGGL